MRRARHQPSKGTFMATGDAPVLETLLEINATALNRAELDPVTMLLVRIAALAAVGAPATSYLMHVGPAVQAGVQFDQVQDVLVTVAPIVGAPRVLTAAQNITDALGIVIAINAAEADAESAASNG
jgi:alkylhydroperoxidase/carboxymuconolactone decarboxylase family protein YurZ